MRCGKNSGMTKQMLCKLFECSSLSGTYPKLSNEMFKIGGLLKYKGTDETVIKDDTMKSY
jgi:hypothetical protein